MSLLSEEMTGEVRERLALMSQPVEIIHFTQELNVEYGRETLELLTEVAAASDKLSLKIYNLVLDREAASEYAIERVPATVVRNGRDYGIRFYGFPAGYEFSELLDVILAVSRDDSGLAAESRKKLSLVRQPVHLEVFVTPTCPHCPRMALLAHRMAIENEYVKADCVEAAEFPDLAGKYDVYSVPKVAVNGSAFIEGAVPEEFFIDAVLTHLGITPASGEATADPPPPA